MTIKKISMQIIALGSKYIFFNIEVNLYFLFVFIWTRYLVLSNNFEQNFIIKFK